MLGGDPDRVLAVRGFEHPVPFTGQDVPGSAPSPIDHRRQPESSGSSLVSHEGRNSNPWARARSAMQAAVERRSAQVPPIRDLLFRPDCRESSPETAQVRLRSVCSAENAGRLVFAESAEKRIRRDPVPPAARSHASLGKLVLGVSGRNRRSGGAGHRHHRQRQQRHQATKDHRRRLVPGAARSGASLRARPGNTLRERDRTMPGTLHFALIAAFRDALPAYVTGAATALAHDRHPAHAKQATISQSLTNPLPQRIAGEVAPVPHERIPGQSLCRRA